MDSLENILDTGGRYLNPNDRQFVTTLLSELEQFQLQAPKDRALMFRPLGGFQRYLIHKVTQVFPKLTSFSIGDDKNRRTVVCFKGKKRDQMAMQGGPGPRGEPVVRNEYMDSPQRSREVDGSRRNTPTNRSRESSRNRKKQDTGPQDKPSARTLESGSHMPKPLRSKKAATKRDRMKRSRSLQSSPLGGDLYALDSEKARGRSRSQSGKPAPRSASLKAPRSRSNRRGHLTSPNISEDERRPPVRPNVSDLSLKKRSQGMRLEGRVINGDVEDPYSCGESGTDSARVDAEVIRREQQRHKHHNKEEEEETSSHISTDSREEFFSDAEVDVPLHNNDEHYYENTGDYDSAATDERPPSYASLKTGSSSKKAERNLHRIKHAGSHHSSRKTSEDEDLGGESSSSVMSEDVELRPKRSSSNPRLSKTQEHKHRSSTLPNSLRDSKKKKKEESPKRVQTMKASRISSKKKPHGSNDQAHHVVKENVSKNSTRNRDKHLTEIDGPKKSRRGSLEQLSSRANQKQHHTLPEKRSSSSKGEGRRKNDVTPTHPSKVEAAAHNVARCDGGTQTEVSGTLPRKKVAEPQATQHDSSSQAKSIGEFLAGMMQTLGVQSQPNQPTQAPPFNPNLNAFHQHLQTLAPPPPQTSFPPLPPHLVHHVYMSWLGAYYAGATGTWPPPAPPSFIVPSSSGNPMAPFDFLSPNMSSFGGSGEGDKHLDGKEHYYDPMFSSNPPDFYAPFRGAEEQQQEKSNPPQSRGESARNGGGDPGSDVLSRNERSISPTASSHGRYGSSIVLTDTDTSSARSSSKKSEVAMATNPKGEVMIYVRSQPSSRCSSVGALHEHVVSDVGSTQSVNERGQQPHAVEKKPPRPEEVKKGKHRPSSLKKRNALHRGNPGETASSRKETIKTNQSNPAVHATSPTHSTAPSRKQSSPIGSPKRGNDVSINVSAKLQDGNTDASQEEIILSLRRAPLATIEDDADDFLSTSLASSSISLQNEKEPNEPPPDRSGTEPTNHQSLDSINRFQSSLADENDVRMDPSSDENESSATSSSLVHPSNATPRDEGKNSNSEDFPPPPYSAAHHVVAADHQIPPIDQSEGGQSSSAPSDEDHPPHNGVPSSDASTTSDGDHVEHPSDSSYDADQSRIEEASQGQRSQPENGLVVQEPQFDYYNWKPEEEEDWKMDKYQRFVEIFNFSPKMSDVELSRYLTKYRGLRLSRVDKSAALCTLPSAEVAAELLSDSFPIFSTRPLSEASEKSRRKARSKLDDAEFEKSRSTRPKTDPSTAKRMIAASLGSRSGASMKGGSK